jgi:hypothetical protein
VGRVAPADKVSSLLDEQGYFHHDCEHNHHIKAKGGQNRIARPERSLGDFERKCLLFMKAYIAVSASAKSEVAVASTAQYRAVSTRLDENAV